MLWRHRRAVLLLAVLIAAAPAGAGAEPPADREGAPDNTPDLWIGPQEDAAPDSDEAVPSLPNAQALRALIGRAEDGESLAQYRLGLRYETGDGVVLDRGRAAEWYEVAVAAGHTDAMFRLSGLLLHGQGVAVDRERALDLLRRAAGDGHRQAQFTLGLLLLQGDRVPFDAQEAERWLVEAAMAGDGEAATLMGNVYLHGDGVAVDEDLALVFLNMGAEAGVAEARLLLARLYREGLGVEADQIRALELVERAASQGSALAMAQLMLLYSDLPIRNRSGQLAYIMAARALWTEMHRPVDLPAQPLPPDLVEIAERIVVQAERLVPGSLRERADEIVMAWSDLLIRAWDDDLMAEDGDLAHGLNGPQPILVVFPDGTLGLAVDPEGGLTVVTGPVPARFTPQEMRELGMENQIPQAPVGTIDLDTPPE